MESQFAIYEGEPSSIVARTLASEDYQLFILEQLEEETEDKGMADVTKALSVGEPGIEIVETPPTPSVREIPPSEYTSFVDEGEKDPTTDADVMLQSTEEKPPVLLDEDGTDHVTSPTRPLGTKVAPKEDLDMAVEDIGTSKPGEEAATATVGEGKVPRRHDKETSKPAHFKHQFSSRTAHFFCQVLGMVFADRCGYQ